MVPKIQIILVDDHRIFRDGIKSLLSEMDYIDIIGEASGGLELLELLKIKQPDLLIVDITMPGMSGIEVARQIACLYPEIKVMILSMHTNEEFVMSAIQAGVKGYLSKDTSREELLDAIKIIYQGGECYGRLVSDQFLKGYAKKYKSELIIHENNDLTNRELELLRLASAGFSNKEIAAKLFISTKTVDCHKNNIMQKLQLKNTAEMVLYAVKNKIIEV